MYSLNFRQAQDLIKCKDAIMAGYRYYIWQLTDIGEPNSEVNEAWDKILNLISDILSKNSV
ncbi:hypothetical protein NQ314_012822 [Rhamnusium bicolor]|uniref:Uncharacterized protein n=1 Tax=Rhamnusium bicolor TaxID=1586634 RepID=A0AAV8X987_9CUCU|nr:hypothetical protein NQ314_012822 [Rhamnusium bicolor]